jgi:hypothetical protein
MGSINSIVRRIWDGMFEKIRAMILLDRLDVVSATICIGGRGEEGSRLERLWKHGQNEGWLHYSYCNIQC